MGDTSEAEIGYVCFKGPHPSFVGEVDHGACGTKAFARISVKVEYLHTNPRGEDYTAEEAAAEIARIVAAAETHEWCAVPGSEQ